MRRHQRRARPTSTARVCLSLLLCVSVAVMAGSSFADARIASAKAPTTTKAKTTTSKSKPAKTKPAKTKTVKSKPTKPPAPTTATVPTPAPPVPVAVQVTVPPVVSPVAETTPPALVTNAGGNEELATPTPVPGGVTTVAAPTTAAPTVAAPTTAAPTTTTTVPPPPPANPASRQTTAGIEPYRGLGAWVDLLDWAVSPTPPKTQKPKFQLPELDAMAAVGVQTLYLQITRRSHPSDIPEPERLLPIIDRAHQLGMYVVAWYVPGHLDVNLDLRRAVAIANLDLDGITIDIESNAVKDVAERNRRLVFFSAELRRLLPGRAIGATVLPPVNTELPTHKLWPTFPYGQITPFFDVWQLMNYWTDLSVASGWRDSYKYTLENMARLRQRTGRPDLPIHLIGGVGDRTNTYDIGVFVRAAVEAGAIGVSTYDWGVTPRDSYAYQWALRYTPAGQTPDPRFVAPQLPPPTLPPSTTTVAPTVPGAVPGAATVPGGATVPVVATVAPTVPGAPARA